MGKYYELNNLEIEYLDFTKKEQERNEIKKKMDKLKEEIVKECEEAIKYLTELINNCSNAYEKLSLRTNKNNLTSLLKLIIGRLQKLDPKNELFRNRKT